VNDSSHPDVPVTPADFATAAPSNVQAVEDLPVEGQPPPPAQRRRSHPSLWNYPATYTLLGINVAVYVLMVLYSHLGLHLPTATGITSDFDSQTLLRFGASDAAMVLQGQWWRLLTANFVHVTLLHIALNMWCLWNLGVFGEPLLGRRGLVWVYLLTGIAGNMLSLGWTVVDARLFNGGDALVAGASGAVFGIAGILIVLLSNRQLSVPWNELKALRRQVIFFAVVNLAIGIGPQLLNVFSTSALGHIANSAHIGGFVCGLALGLPLFPRMMSGRVSYRRRQTQTFIVATLVLCLIGYAISAFAR
jgi:rhomboid protease GluP